MIFGGEDPMKTKREMKNTNKGFTLIELIVTVAIIAIFSGVILMFVTTGSNTYRSTSSTAKVQMETQETFDRIEDMIIDVNRSLYYANVSGKSIGSEIKDDITCTPFGLYILIEKTEPSPPFMYRKVHSCMKYNESMSQNTHSL